MPKRVPPLNSKQIEKWKPDPNRTLELVDGAVPGLRVRLSPSGTKSWSFNVRIAGQRRRLTLGEGLGLADARRRADDVRRKIADGEDPASEKRAARQRRTDAAAGLGTFRAVVAAYFEIGPGAALKSGAAQRKHIEAVFAEHMKAAAIDVRPGVLQLAIDAWPSRSSGLHAAAYIRPVCRWATKRGLMLTGFEALEAPAMEGEGGRELSQRVLSNDEVAKLLRALGSTPHDTAARFMILTGARRAEVCGATWGEIDLSAKRWLVLATRRKDTRAPSRRRRRRAADHVIPLSRQALDILRSLPAAKPGDLVFAGLKGAQLTNWPRWSARLETKLKIAGATPHALRRTTATIAGNLGHPPHVVSALLGHAAIGGSLHAGYNQSGYGNEVAAALQQVADLLSSLEAAGTI